MGSFIKMRYQVSLNNRGSYCSKTTYVFATDVKE